MAVRRDVISITLRRLIMSTFLIRSATSQSSSYPIVLMRLGGPRSRPNPHLEFVEYNTIYNKKKTYWIKRDINWKINALGSKTNLSACSFFPLLFLDYSFKTWSETCISMVTVGILLMLAASWRPSRCRSLVVVCGINLTRQLFVPPFLLAPLAQKQTNQECFFSKKSMS